MEENLPAALEVPIEILSAEALTGIMEEFIQREGTDYGWTEASPEKKMEQIRQQLAKGDIKIIFDPSTESITLLTKTAWQKAQFTKEKGPDAGPF